MDPLTRGGLFHEFQFRLFTVLRDREMLPVTEVNLEDVSQAAEDVMTEVADSYKEQLSPAIPRIWDSEIAGLRTDMKGWLREVVAEGNWVPMRFEFAFGLPPGPGRDAESALEEALVLGGIRLRGSVDLVERNAFSGSLRVTDHKTGKAPIEKALVVKGGEVLQPLLYGLAAEQLLGIPAEEGQLFYCTQRGGFQRLKVPIDSGTCDKFKVVLETIDRSLEAGFLPAAPREKACTYCDYHMVCGPYEEIRIARKLPDELKDLQQLRSLP
jgi:CRISPR/Cas system-associated exonuclease Cas4 (RecB family)